MRRRMPNAASSRNAAKKRSACQHGDVRETPRLDPDNAEHDHERS